MLPGYLERHLQTLTPTEVERARTCVAEALRAHRAATPGTDRSTRPVYRRWQATKRRILG
jgi:hypothetical protein